MAIFRFLRTRVHSRPGKLPASTYSGVSYVTFPKIVFLSEILWSMRGSQLSTRNRSTGRGNSKPKLLASEPEARRFGLGTYCSIALREVALRRDAGMML